MVINLTEQKIYAYTKDENGKLILSNEFDSKVGEKTGLLDGSAGNFKTKTGFYRVTEIHENYTTPSYTTSASTFFGSFNAPFGKFAIKMGPNASGQWMHGTTRLLGDLSVLTGIGSGSHGCIRMTNSGIEDIALNIAAGTPIIRIYADKVTRNGESYETENIYNYADFNGRTFDPEKLTLIGPEKSFLSPTNAEHGGETNYKSSLKELGFTLVEQR
ncbi:MAG: L,D-transpeptidase [Saprospiraceae bacterium]|nr:L,D-transpeptidase [Saprospiraceae bacterium]